MDSPAPRTRKEWIGRSFFDRPTTEVARDLLGAIIEVRNGARIRRARLVETEAYLSDDPASHSFRGVTRRNASMFAGPGTVYVYRIHQVVCVNLVTRRAEAVLLRAAEPIQPPETNPSGPGRLCRALGIALEDDGSSVTSSRIRLYRGSRLREKVTASRRVGIHRAVEPLLRFSLVGNRWVSVPKPWTTKPSKR